MTNRENNTKTKFLNFLIKKKNERRLLKSTMKSKTTAKNKFFNFAIKKKEKRQNKNLEGATKGLDP
jgi:hypothetical protein